MCDVGPSYFFLFREAAGLPDRGEVFWVEDFGYLAPESNADGSAAFVKMYGEKEYEDRGDRFSIGFLFTMNATK